MVMTRMQLAVVLLIISILVQPLHSGAHFQLTFINFTVTNANVCDRRSSCDPYFIIKVVSNQVRTYNTDHWRNEDAITFNDNMMGVANPIKLNFSYYIGQVTLSVEVYEFNGNKNHPEIDTVTSVLSTAAPGIQSLPDVQGRPTTGYKLLMKGDSVVINVKFSVTCHAYYFGKNCSINCVPQNDTGGHFTCTVDGQHQCRPGWLTLPNCLVQDHCYSQSCLNGGTCENRANTYTCKCPVNYNGTRCEERLSKCVYDNPCQLGSECHTAVNNVSQTWCVCKPGYNGSFCQLDIDECLPNNPCKNNGTCGNTDGSYQCICSNRHYGKHCDLYHHLCEDISPCLNGATCIDTGNQTYTCNCAQGFNGSNCEIDVDECKLGNPCKNNGICWNTFGSYRCNCSDRHFGKHCEFYHHLCEDTFPCLNDATCIDEENQNYTCSCIDGFSGNHCEIKNDKTTLIIIIAVSLLVAVIILIFTIMIICCCCCRKKAKYDSHPSTHDTEAEGYYDVIQLQSQVPPPGNDTEEAYYDIQPEIQPPNNEAGEADYDTIQYHPQIPPPLKTDSQEAYYDINGLQPEKTTPFNGTEEVYYDTNPLQPPNHPPKNDAAEVYYDVNQPQSPNHPPKNDAAEVYYDVNQPQSTNHPPKNDAAEVYYDINQPQSTNSPQKTDSEEAYYDMNELQTEIQPSRTAAEEPFYDTIIS